MLTKLEKDREKESMKPQNLEAQTNAA